MSVKIAATLILVLLGCGGRTTNRTPDYPTSPSKKDRETNKDEFKEVPKITDPSETGSGDLEENIEDDLQSESPQKLSGTYESKCEKIGGTTEYRIFEISFTNNQFDTHFRYFADAKCTAATLQSEIKEKSVFSTKPRDDGMIEVDYEVIKMLLTPRKKEVVDQLKKNNSYGIGNWRINAPRDIFGLSPNGEVSPVEYYNIWEFKKDDSEFCFGYTQIEEKKRPKKTDICLTKISTLGLQKRRIANPSP